MFTLVAVALSDSVKDTANSGGSLKSLVPAKRIR